MKGTLGKTVVLVVALLAAAAPAGAEEQTRDTYKASVEPICEANRSANERIMEGARERINRNDLVPAGKQFVRVSESFGGMVRKIATVPPPVGDEHRIERWLEQMRLLKQRLRNVGKYYKAGEEIRGTHESILAERAGLGANNISIVFHFRYCRFARLG